MTLCTAGLLTLGFRAPHWRDALMVALAGVGNGIAQLWWTRSLSLAPPSAVVPFNYLSLVWATILGFAVWGDVPTQACWSVPQSLSPRAFTFFGARPCADKVPLADSCFPTQLEERVAAVRLLSTKYDRTRGPSLPQ